MEIAAARNFNFLYIYLDLIWICLFCGLLWITKRRLALGVGIAAGFIYFLVDYGIWYSILGTRVITGANPFWLLLWLSFTYGITNFAWIWILLDRDKFRVEWSILIIGAWLTVALISQNFGSNFPKITTDREASSYHGIMAAVMFIGYFILIYRNLRNEPGGRIAILPLLAIGIGIQLSWEAVLLITGIRPSNIIPLAVNSLVETNLGLPYAYLIHKALKKRFQ